MRVFLAGATGVLGIRIVPLLVAAGHAVGGMTRSPSKAGMLSRLGAEPIMCDVYDGSRLAALMSAFAPDAVMSQLTDLPDDPDLLPGRLQANDRMRTEGIDLLLAAYGESGASHLVVQSVAFTLPEPSAAAVAHLETATLDRRGVVARYGQLYGPGTYFESRPPPPPRVAIEAAARRTVPLLDAEPGIVEIVD